MVARNSVWDELQNSELPPPKEDLAKWEAEFNQIMSAQRDEVDLDYGQDMLNAWDQGLGDYDEGRYPALKYTEAGLPLLGDYVFGTYTQFVF